MKITFLSNDKPIATLETETDISFEAAAAIAATLERELGTPVTVDTGDV